MAAHCLCCEMTLDLELEAERRVTRCGQCRNVLSIMFPIVMMIFSFLITIFVGIAAFKAVTFINAVSSFTMLPTNLPILGLEVLAQDYPALGKSMTDTSGILASAASSSGLSADFKSVLANLASMLKTAGTTFQQFPDTSSMIPASSSPSLLGFALGGLRNWGKIFSSLSSSELKSVCKPLADLAKSVVSGSGFQLNNLCQQALNLISFESPGSSAGPMCEIDLDSGVKDVAQQVLAFCSGINAA